MILQTALKSLLGYSASMQIIVRKQTSQFCISMLLQNLSFIKSDWIEIIWSALQVLVALFAYVPVIRDKLPPSPVVTKIDVVFYSVVMLIIIVLVEQGIQQSIYMIEGWPTDLQELNESDFKLLKMAFIVILALWCVLPLSIHSALYGVVYMTASMTERSHITHGSVCR